MYADLFMNDVGIALNESHPQVPVQSPDTSPSLGLPGHVVSPAFARRYVYASFETETQ